MSTVELDLTEKREVSAPMNGVVIGVLIGFCSDGNEPLVVYREQPGTAGLRAASTVDLHGAHIGRSVVLVFENGDLRHPIIIGLLHSHQGWPAEELPASVQVEADGESLVVSAREQLVLKCGKASLTLTCSGKIIIQGAYISQRSSGVVRIKGGSVQIN
jgi:hypothetical protein